MKYRLYSVRIFFFVLFIIYSFLFDILISLHFFIPLPEHRKSWTNRSLWTKIQLRETRYTTKNCLLTLLNLADYLFSSPMILPLDFCRLVVRQIQYTNAYFLGILFPSTTSALKLEARVGRFVTADNVDENMPFLFLNIIFIEYKFKCQSRMRFDE